MWKSAARPTASLAMMWGKARSSQHENDAAEIANPDTHRDEAPEGGGK